MGLDDGRPARVLTYLLMAVAYLASDVASHLDGHLSPFGVGIGLKLFALAVGGGFRVPTPGHRADQLPKRLTAIGLVALGLPLVLEPIVREVTGAGLPTELLLVNGLRNIGLTLTAFSAWPRARRLAGIVALFLTLFVLAMGDQWAIPYLLVALAVIGGLWLVADYRAGLAGTDLADRSPTVATESVRLRIPAREFGLLTALVVAAGGVVVAGPTEVVAALGELVPTSGGTGEYDPFSRGGVNDGTEEMAGLNPNTAGMVDSDQMIESQEDSLIDAVSDMYGPLHKPRKNREQMVTAGWADVQQSHKTPINKKPSREFNTSRQGPKNARQTPGQDARSLIEVSGRTPLHIRMTVYDEYDPKWAAWNEARPPSGRYIDPAPTGSE